MKNNKFENIRPYNDFEVNEVINHLVNDKNFSYILNKIFPEENIKGISEKLCKISTIYDLQTKYILPYLNLIISKTINNLSYSGFEKINNHENYLFVTNHRDIILDSALLNQILFQNNYSTTEIGVGSNLLIFNWIEKLIKLNKSFIVKRNLQGKEMLNNSFELSEYIRDTITKRNQSVWIAQRQGRTKDGNDKTQPGLLKMLNLSGKNNFLSNVKELNIVPVAISYEYEPCTVSKINETIIKKYNSKYFKTPADDLRSMGKGLYSKKGNVHFTFTNPINKSLEQISDNKSLTPQYLTELIDRQIYKGFKLSPFNYIAYDILHGKDNKNKYTKKDIEKFVIHKKDILSNVENRENKISENIFYDIYANPVLNKLNSSVLKNDYKSLNFKKHNFAVRQD